MSNINEKNAPNQMRIFMKRMRDGNEVISEIKTPTPKKNLDVRDMLKITRDIHDGVVVLNEDVENKITIYDQKNEEEKFRGFFNDIEVSVKFTKLVVTNNFIFWGGIVDGVIQFTFNVTSDETSTGVKYDYTDDFSPDNPENKEITDRINAYFKTFYKYWRSNILDSSNDGGDEPKMEPKVRQLNPNQSSPDELKQGAE